MSDNCKHPQCRIYSSCMLTGTQHAANVKVYYGMAAFLALVTLAMIAFIIVHG